LERSWRRGEERGERKGSDERKRAAATPDRRRRPFSFLPRRYPAILFSTVKLVSSELPLVLVALVHVEKPRKTSPCALLKASFSSRRWKNKRTKRKGKNLFEKMETRPP